MKNRKIVFYTGAGISKESGMPTFRGEGGLWDTLDVTAVADARNWYSGRRNDCRERRQTMLDFFNPLRRAILNKEPNEAHYIIADLEKEYDVTVITQNGDDFHTRAGSTDIIYLHGEALKNASTLHPYEAYEIDKDNPDIRIGDKAPDSSQLRPFVIYFNEDIDIRLWNKASNAARSADIFVVVGSTMLVYPAADLLKMLPSDCKLYVVDPGNVTLPDGCVKEYVHIQSGASQGLKQLKSTLKLK